MAVGSPALALDPEPTLRRDFRFAAGQVTHPHAPCAAQSSMHPMWSCSTAILRPHAPCVSRIASMGSFLFNLYVGKPWYPPMSLASQP